jgi:hypothetical protein
MNDEQFVESIEPAENGRALRDFRLKFEMSQADVAGKLGLSKALISQLESGKSTWTAWFGYALRGLALELDRSRPKVHWRPPLVVPPHNRTNIRCAFLLPNGTICNKVMDRLVRSKAPETGQRIWRMFCKGAKNSPHPCAYAWVDDFGNPVANPPRSRRRRLAPFEKRLGPATCQACRRTLQWQEQFKNRWHYSVLYCYRCINPKCELFRRRVYRDADGRVVQHDPRQRDVHGLPRWAASCPVKKCGSRLWKSGVRGNLTCLVCQSARRPSQNYEKHRDGLINWPKKFYIRPGRRIFFVYSSRRKPDGQRRLLCSAPF